MSRFVYGSSPLVPDYVVKGGSTYRIFSDQIGSPRVIADVSSGSVVERIDYDERGNVTKDTNPGFIPFGFAGGLVDSLTGLIQYGARDYDPKTGRWKSKDATGFSGGTNFYEYAKSDPLNRVDVTGRDPLVIAGAAIGFFGDLGWQLANNGGNFGCVDWKQVGVATAIGAAVGLVGPLAFDEAFLADEAGAFRIGAPGVGDEIQLAKQLASESQLGEMAAGEGTPFAGAGTDTAFRDAGRVAATYGGDAADWAKVSSSTYNAADGTVFATHWVEKAATGVQAEAKVVIEVWPL